MMSLSLRGLLIALLLPLTLLAPAAHAQGTLVRVHTTQGVVDLRLLDQEAPVTVANFLTYVRAGDWRGMFFHRRVAGFVLQGGGYRWPEGASCCPAVTKRPAITNEFSATRSNLRGTVAMAKLPTGPDTATSEWFVNLGNNAANLDNQNGGFTVFARVTTPGMGVVDRIAALPIVNAGSPFNELPVADYTAGQVVLRSNMVLVSDVTELAQATESDRIFNYLEAAYPQYLSPATGAAGTADGYTYRYYSGSNAYVGTRDGRVYYLVPALGPGIGELGTVAEWLATAQAAGY